MIIHHRDHLIEFRNMQRIINQSDYILNYYEYEKFMNNNGYNCKLISGIHTDHTDHTDQCCGYGYWFEMDDIDYVAFKLRFGDYIRFRNSEDATIFKLKFG